MRPPGPHLRVTDRSDAQWKTMLVVILPLHLISTDLSIISSLRADSRWNGYLLAPELRYLRVSLVFAEKIVEKTVDSLDRIIYVFLLIPLVYLCFFL